MRRLKPLLIILVAVMLAGSALPVLANLAAPLVFTVQDSTLKTSHSMTLANLTPGTTYYFAPTSCDAEGNCTTAPQQSFVTGQAPATATATLAPPTATVVTITPTQASTATATVASTFASSASAAPSPVSPSQTTTITVQVTSSQTRMLLIDIELYSPGNVQVAQQVANNQQFSAGVARAFTMPWTVPPSAPPGAYVIKVGVFLPDWLGILHWNDGAGTVGVSAVPATATSTPVVPSTPTRTPTLLPTATILPTATATPAPAFVDVEMTCRFTFDLFGVPVRVLCE